jgi:eukaryotic-like serine/threonine-protein kinase
VKFELQEQLGKYPLIREIGSGATSSVYLARDPFTERDVAIKVFLFDKGTDAQSERMKHKAFVTEASLAGMLNHPHIIDIFDAVVEPDHSYLVMEYVPGVTLEAHADVTSLLPVSKVVEIIFKCVRALDYAFQHGVIHRDIKPGNIMLSEGGETKVGDFGASFQQRHETTQITGIGSPAYMSPEQIRMEPLNHQTDIYSLGVTMYRLLTGRLPYQANTQAALAYAILNTPPAAPLTLRPDLPPVLDRIAMKAISKEPADRYATWHAFGKDLTAAFTSLRLEGHTANDAEKFNILRNMPFFQDFGDVALWEVVRIGSWKTIATEEVVIHEGDEGDSFFLLIEGDVEVTLEDSHLATLKPGACFGEMLYYSDHVTRRTSSVTAVSAITVIEIKSIALRAATDACQAGFNKAVIRVLIDKLNHSNLKLAGR